MELDLEVLWSQVEADPYQTSRKLAVTLGKTSASAVLIARDRVKNENLLPGYEFNFTVRFDECTEILAVGYTVELIQEFGMDAIIGPTCSYPAIVSAVAGAYYNIPTFIWGLATSSVLDNMVRFPTTALSAVNSLSSPADPRGRLSLVRKHFDRYRRRTTKAAIERSRDAPRHPCLEENGRDVWM
uniref:Extracellular ligand-binding receptor domain containing protein n=1 Tax=Haemonchus contortus TaxID=6289 RepID=W6NQL1_HAECO